jgi:hypothetical protein
LFKYRGSSNWLLVETGKWYNISRNDRLCHFCNSNDTGDEFHYIMTCNLFQLWKKKKTCHIIVTGMEIFLKFNQLFLSEHITVLEILNDVKSK